MKKLLLTLSFIVLCGNNLYSQLAFFTPSEGLQTAEAEVKTLTNNYKLVGILTVVSKLELSGIPITTQVATSGADIGKANMWDYVFWDKANSRAVEIIVLHQTMFPPPNPAWLATNFTEQPGGGLLDQMSKSIVDGINLDTTLDLSTILSSEEWVPQLLQKEGFTLSELVVGGSGYMMGVWMPSTLEFGHANQFNWYCINMAVNDAGVLTRTWCYSLATNTDITCETPNDIMELPAVNVEISPNPVADMLMISADIEVKDVNIYDISGNLVKQCGENVNNIDVSGLLAGTYYISLSFGDVKVFRQFVKTNW